ncbi:MAG: BON domain-containing protein [Deinococcota bacterium]
MEPYNNKASQTARGNRLAPALKGGACVGYLVNEALEDEHGVDASDIEVQVQNGEVTLTGTVSDRSQKRMSEDCVERVRGVRHVHNQLRVQPQASLGETSSSGGTSGNTSSPQSKR